tara:strand:- start:27 stop:245 length:219 start_codon:yes stop_codon:yes gene_type:complete
MKNETLMEGEEDYLEDTFPAVTKALVDQLEALYPDRCPDITDPDRLIWLKAGQRSVITFLSSRYREQNDLGE